MKRTNEATARPVVEQEIRLHGRSAVDLMIAADAVQRAIEKLDDDDVHEVGRIVMERRSALAERNRDAFSACESPIERALLAALLECGFTVGSGPTGAIAYNPVGSAALYAQRQVTAGGKTYRLDFAVEASNSRIAVECDGHDFHERTKEQARHDRSRDRTLTLAGWTVLRFTGSEIHQDAIRCASDVIVAARCDTPKGAPVLTAAERQARLERSIAALGPRPNFDKPAVSYEIKRMALYRKLRARYGDAPGERELRAAQARAEIAALDKEHGR